MAKKDEPSINSIELKTERDIAMDFATKVYKKFDKLVKSIILFGSTAKRLNVPGSDIDIIIVIDDASILFDNKTIVWYREELGKIIDENKYKKDLHINTIKLTTWWEDFYHADPALINVIRYGEAMIDFGGFFNPLKILLEKGKIRPTPESIHSALNRVPSHITRSKISELNSIEGCFWAYVDSSHALLMAIGKLPPSPENIPELLKENFTKKGLLKQKYIDEYEELFRLHKKIAHGEIKDIKGKIIDEWQDKSEDYFNTIMKLIKEII